MIPPTRLDVFQIRNFVLGSSKDVRPCIVLEVLDNGDVEVVPISGQVDFYRGEWADIWIDEQHPDFEDTGLTKSCFAIGDKIGTIEQEQMTRKRGILKEELGKSFEDWI